MTPRLEACYFAGEDNRWRRMARVLAHTAHVHCPDWQITVRELPANLPPTGHGVRSDQANSLKLEHWASVIADAAEGDRVLLIDADTLILRPLDEVWTLPFDWAYTTKQSRFPFNGGVMFLRVSSATKAVMAEWMAENRRMLRDEKHHRHYRLRYAGINQSAFGALLERGALQALHVRALPCLEWNCEDSAWGSFDPAVTRIVHIKSGLREACVHGFIRRPELAPLVACWREAADAAAESLRRAG